jgi:hypothetical protein
LPTRIAGLGLILVLGLLVRKVSEPPCESPPVSALDTVAKGFRFTRFPVPELASRPLKGAFEVNPSIAHMQGWYSSVGAGVSFTDLDGDGLSNDLCRVEPRSRDVILAPAPGTGDRYPPFLMEDDRFFDARTMSANGCLPGDFNEDGLTDLLILFQGRPPLLFLRRAEPGPLKPPRRDSYVTVELVPGLKQTWFTPTATLTDVDNDGHIDIVVANYHRDGDTVLDPTSTKPVQYADSFSRGFNAGYKRIFLWQSAASGDNPTVQYKQAESPFPEKEARAWTLAVGAADLDKDGRSDIYFANDFGPDNLYWNQSTPGHVKLVRLEGERGFNVPESKVLGHDSNKGMGIDFGDVNGDGYFDMFVSNIAARFSLNEGHFLWESTGDVSKFQKHIAPYVERGEPLGLSLSDWGWDTKFADFNNDGVLEAIQAVGFIKGKTNRWARVAELAIGSDELTHIPAAWQAVMPDHDLAGGSQTPFYVRLKADGPFYDVADRVGLGGIEISRGFAISDVDGDGDLDLAVASQWRPSAYFRNDLPGSHPFLGLRLLQPNAGVQRELTSVHDGMPASPAEGWPAIGAFASATLPDGKVLIRQVDGGNGHTGRRSQDIHFGLGAVDPKQKIPVHIRWRAAGGKLVDEDLALEPGWHTVLLGTKPEQS